MGLGAKPYRFLTDDNDKSKTVKYTQNLSWKRKYEDYRNCLEATQLEHKIIHPRFIKNHKEFMKKIKQY